MLYNFLANTVQHWALYTNIAYFESELLYLHYKHAVLSHVSLKSCTSSSREDDKDDDEELMDEDGEGGDDDEEEDDDNVEEEMEKKDDFGQFNTDYEWHWQPT